MKTYNWRRFWVRRSGAINLADGGYLVDPAGKDGALWNPDIVSEESLRDAPCLVLLGEPGIGKTTALEAQVGALQAGTTLYVDLSGFSSEVRLVRDVFEAPSFTRWLDSTDTLTIFLDSLDECLLHIRTVSTLLANEFSKVPASRLRLRMACRTAEWPETLHYALPAIWGDANTVELELAPLRRADVALAAREEGLEETEFLRQVDRLDLVPLASRPITLRLLLSVYQRDNSLPSTVTDLYEQGCLWLVRESAASRHDSKMAGRLSAAQRLDLASRLAAATILGRRPAVFVGTDLTQAVPDDLLIDDLVSGRIGQGGRAVEQADVREALDTGLFSGRKGLRLGWTHWTFAEFLAARFTQIAGLSDDQLGDLLLRRGIDGREHVIPQLREVVAWVASSRPAFLRRVAEGDPQVLLRGSLTNMDAAGRAILARTLLNLAADGQLDDRELELRKHYDVLADPGLPDLLRPYFKDRARGVVPRRMAIDIAEACNCRDLIQDLFTVAFDKTDDPYIRSQAAYAILTIGDQEQRQRLRPLLFASDKEDPDDELKGVALQALWPRHLSAKELFEEHLTLPRNPSLMGAYGAFTWRFPNQLQKEHLPAALAWVTRQGSDHSQSSRFSDLPSRIMKAAWLHLDDPTILTAFAEAALHRLNEYDPILGEGSGVSREDELLANDSEKRRRLIVALVPRLIEIDPDRARVLAHRLAGILQLSDFGWLIEQLDLSPDERASRWWIELTRRAFDPSRLEHVEALLGGVAHNNALLSQMRQWVEPVALDSEEARAMRAGHKELKELRQRPPKPPVQHAPLPVIVTRWLDKAESGDEDAWWRLNRDMTISEDSDYYPSNADLEPDLTKLPGWQAIDAATRVRCLNAAFQYISKRDPADHEWLGKNIIYRPAAAGYRAFRLLLQEDPARLGDVAPEVWAKWAASILNYPERQGDRDESPILTLVALAYRHAPQSLLAALEVLIDKDNREHRTVFVTGKLSKAWNKDLAMALLHKASDPAMSGVSTGILLKDALPLAPEESRAVALALLNKRHDGDAESVRAQFGAVALLQQVPASSWPDLWPILKSEPDFGLAVMETLAYEWRLAETARLLTDLSEPALADLYLELRKRVPDERQTEAGVVTAREALIHLREYVLEALKRRGTSEAVRELKRIVNELPELPWLKHAVLAGEDARLRESWHGIDIADLEKLASDQTVRLVEDDEQLIQVVIASLARLQTTLQGETPAVHDLWNEKPSRPKDEVRLSDQIKRHLERDLKLRGVIANREVELRRTDQTDIRVDAISRRKDQSHERLSVLLEVKGCWNPELTTGMENQLRDRYMANSGCRSGIYVVGWYMCQAWDSTDYRKTAVPKWTVDEARQFFERQADALSGSGFTLRSCLIDATLPDQPESPRYPATRSRQGRQRRGSRPKGVSRSRRRS